MKNAKKEILDFHWRFVWFAYFTVLQFVVRDEAAQENGSAAHYFLSAFMWR